MKIKEYTTISDLSDDRVLLSDGANGTKTIPITDLLYKLIDYGGEFAGKNRKNTARGKDLGSTVTADQWNKISKGTFTDMFLGDYWLIGDKHWRIWDMDYLLNTGNTNVMKKHHLVIVPDESLGNGAMESSNITTNGYAGTAMRKDVLPGILTMIEGVFGSGHILGYDDPLTTASANGIASAYAWQTDLKVELMSEIMVCGTRHIASGSNGTAIANIYTVCKTQFALPRIRPSIITTRYWYWLRDIVSGASFATVGGAGDSYSSNASGSHGLRPFFIIGV